MSKIKVLFMGTPEFCIPSLRALHEEKEIDLAMVISQPDSLKGRKLKLTPSPVKEFCLANEIQVETPLKVSTPDWIERLRAYEFDVVVVLAYGQILKQSLLDISPNNFLNIHGSLLPRWRGAAPIQRAIMEGDQETGISFQVMRFKLDSGPVIFEKKIMIKPNETSIELADRLSLISGEEICAVVKAHAEGKTNWNEQNEDLVTYAKKLTKSEGLVDFKENAQKIHDKIRGLQWGPGAYTNYKGKRLKLLNTLVSKDRKGALGEVFKIPDDEQILWIGTAKGALGVQTVQLEGKPRMSVKDFINGYGLTQGFSFLKSEL